MDNTLCTDSDLKREIELRRAYEMARVAWEQAQPHLDELQSSCEWSRAQYFGSCHCPGTSPERTATLSRECSRLEAERDKAIEEVKKPLREAREGLSRHIGRFACSASAWLDQIRQSHNFDAELGRLILGIRRDLERSQKELRPLSEIVKIFEGACEKIKNWKLADPPRNPAWGSGQVHTGRLQIPRLEDFLNR